MNEPDHPDHPDRSDRPVRPDRADHPFSINDDPDEEERVRVAKRAAREAEAKVSEDPGEIEIDVDRARPPSLAPGDTAVDARTVAEKLGKAVAVVAGTRPPPPGWPVEALTFPLRRPGPALIAGGAVSWVLLDSVTLLPALAFLGYLLKLIALPLFVRWQIHEASMTAAGQERPVGWLRAMEFDREQVMGTGRLLLAALVLSLPGLVAFHFERTTAGLLLLVVALLWVSVGALGLAVGERGFLLPWRVAYWLGKRPLGLAAATLGWWAAGFTEVGVKALAASSTELGLSVALCLAMRLVTLYLWLVSARALGVVGRSWTP